MTIVKWIMKRPRLSKLIDVAGGTTVVSALRVADQNTQALRADALVEVDHILDDLEALMTTPPADPAAWLSQTYGLASSLLDVAGPFDLGDMCKAAYSLCELADRQKQGARLEAAPVKVHVSSLRLLRQLSDSPDARQQILVGLEALLDRDRRRVAQAIPPIA